MHPFGHLVAECRRAYFVSRLAVEVVDPGGRSEDNWLVELARGVMSRFTFDPANDVYPVWSPDATRIMFASDREGGDSTCTESDRTVRATTSACSSQVTRQEIEDGVVSPRWRTPAGPPPITTASKAAEIGVARY